MMMIMMMMMMMMVMFMWNESAQLPVLCVLIYNISMFLFNDVFSSYEETGRKGTVNTSCLAVVSIYTNKQTNITYIYNKALK